MENNSIREFTCNDCQEVTKVDWSKVRPDIDDGTSNIEIHEKGNGYAYYGECMNCGNLVEIEPPVPELVVDNVDVDKDGMYIQLTDTVTNRSCWIEAWQDKNGDWEYDFNQYIFHLDNENDVVAKMFQEDLGNYSEEVFDCVMGAIDDHEEEYNKLQENKAPTMRDRLKEVKSKFENKEVKTESLYGEWIDLLDKIPADKIEDYKAEYDLYDKQINGDEKPTEMILPKLIAGAKKYIESKEVKTESAPADVIEYFGMQDNTDETFKNNVAKEYKTLRAKYPDKEMILNGDFGTYLGTEKAEPIEKGEYITVYDKVEENKTIKTEDTISSEFNLYIKPEELADANISSLLFESNQTIAIYKEGPYELSLVVNGEVAITDTKTGEQFSGVTDFNDDIINSIKNGTFGNGTDRYDVSLNNWFEYFLYKDGEEVWYDVAEDIEGGLGNGTPAEMETELEIIMQDTLHDIVGQLNEGKKVEAKFKDKVKAIKKSLKKNDKRLSDETAEKSAEKIAGSMVKKEESKTADMDTVDIVTELEGGELTIADVEDWNAVKSVASDLQNSQGYYGRLLRDMLEVEEEFGGVENLPFPITM